MQNDFDDGSLDFYPETKNIKCCHFLLKSVSFFKECIVILISTIVGLCYIISSIVMLFYLIPSNMYHTIGISIKNLDLFINIAFIVCSFNNFIAGIHLVSITYKQKSIFSWIAKKCCVQKKKIPLEKPDNPQERLNKLIEDETQSIFKELGYRIMHPTKNYLFAIMILMLNNVFIGMLSNSFYIDLIDHEIYHVY